MRAGFFPRILNIIPTDDPVRARSRRACYRYHYAPRLLNLSGFHATHDTELLAVFGIANDLPGCAATLLGCRAGAVTDTMQSHWLNFARHSVPESTWPAYTTERRGTLIIDHRSASKLVHRVIVARGGWATTTVDS